MWNMLHSKSEAQRKHEFANMLEAVGWKTEMEVKILSNCRFDLTLLKDNEIIHIIEVKKTNQAGSVLLIEENNKYESKQTRKYYDTIKTFADPAKLGLVKLNKNGDNNQEVLNGIEKMKTN